MELEYSGEKEITEEARSVVKAENHIYDGQGAFTGLAFYLACQQQQRELTSRSTTRSRVEDACSAQLHPSYLATPPVTLTFSFSASPNLQVR